MELQIRVFNTCLNKERKVFNCSFPALIVGGVMLTLTGIRFGIVFGLVAAGVGYLLGTYLGKCWHKGELQRYLYLHLPFARLWLDQVAPDSHLRKLI